MFALHTSDLPTIVSGKKVGFIEPFGKVWRGKFGRQYSIGPSMQNTLAPLKGICGFSMKLRSYGHTLFRFPLRQSPSKLSESCYSIDRLLDLLGALKEEAQYLLLFLHSVDEICVFEINIHDKSKELFHVKISEYDIVSRQRKTFYTSIQLARECHSLTSYTADFHVESYDTLLNTTINKRWLVVSQVGSDLPPVWKEAGELKVLPWAGCALEIIEGAAGNHRHVCNGRISCFLPMPKETYSPLPVHVNGTFGLNDDRRTLKWPSGERRHDPAAEWNMTIVKQLLPPCYVNLILEAIKVGVSHEQVYRAWPQLKKIAHTTWNGLITPLMDNLLQKDVFWSENASMQIGEWISLHDATFIPHNEELNSVVSEVLSCCNVKLVDIPNHIWDAVSESEMEVKIVSPSLLRDELRSHEHTYTSLSHGDKCKILSYCLSDGKYEDLHCLKLLPLAIGGFEIFTDNAFGIKKYYVCSEKYPRSLLLNIGDCIVDLSDVDEGLHDDMLKVASSGKTQLHMLDAYAVSKLLPSSQPKGWKGRLTVNISGSNRILKWLEKFWMWLEHQDISLFKNLMLLPVVKSTTELHRNISIIKLASNSKVVFLSDFSSLANNTEVLKGLQELNILFTGDMDNFFPFLHNSHRKLLSYGLVNEATPGGVLNAIANVYVGRLSSLQDVRFTDTQALELQCFFNNPHVVGTYEDIMKFLPLFKLLNQTKRFSLKAAAQQSFGHKAVLECDGSFGIRTELLPSNLVVMSSTENQRELICKYPSIISTPNKIRFIMNNLIPMISCKAYSGSLDDLMVEILNYFLSLRKESSESRDLQDRLKDLKFLQSNASSDRKSPKQLYDISDKELKALFKGEPVFPKPPFTDPYYLQALCKCGLRQSVTAQEIVNIITSISSGFTTPNKISRAKAVLHYLSKQPHILGEKVSCIGWSSLETALQHISAKKPWLPIKVNPPDDYPKCMLWKGKGKPPLSQLSSSTLVCSIEETPALSFIVGSQIWIISCPSNLCHMFPTVNPTKNVAQHFQNIIQHCQNIDVDIMDYIVCETYKHFSNNMTSCNLREFLPDAWLWIRRHNCFVSSQKIALRSHHLLKQNLEPYLFLIPDNFSIFFNLFRHLGVIEHFSQSQVLSVLAALRNKSSQLQLEESWAIVMGILNWLTAEGSQAINLKGSETLYVPIESTSYTLSFADSRSVYYVDDESLKEFLEAVDEEYILCHDRINHLASKLGITPLSEPLDISDDFFEDIGQYEPLEVRIRNILRDYTDGITIVKELLQNADDAGATEVNLCFDARLHKTECRIFPGMAKCNGMALIVHNDAVFEDEDFENITKLAGATKQNKLLKIGKFGVGFCSVYHITDVPSFVSREYFCVFDPTLTCLKKHIKDKSRPGKKIKFTKKLYQQSGLLAPFKDFYGFDARKSFKGTIFRFPFRNSFSELSRIKYTERHIQKLVKDLQSSFSKTLLFLQSVKRVTFSHFREGKSSPYTLLDLKRDQQVLSPEMQLLKISHKTQDYDSRHSKSSSYKEESYLVSVVTDKVEFILGKKDAIASVACQLEPLPQSDSQKYTVKRKRSSVPTEPKQYSVIQLKGEVFCFLPLGLRSGLPVHISANFAVLNDRTGIRSSEEYDSGANEAQWNVKLMNTVIPKAYLNLLLHLSIMPNSKYCFHSLWPLKRDLRVHNPWDVFLNPLYQLIATEKLLFSHHVTKWLTLQESKFLSSNILCLTPESSIPVSVCEVVDVLRLPVIDLPSEYLAHFPYDITSYTLTQEEFVRLFFEGTHSEKLSVKTRNKTLLYLLKYFAIHPEDKSLEKVLKGNCCIPCSPNGKLLKRCQYVIDPEAHFAVLYTPYDGVFPAEAFYKSSIRPALIDLGMVTGHLPWDRLVERAKTVAKLMSRGKATAMKRVKAILKCIESNLSQTQFGQYSVLERTPVPKKCCAELKSIKFLPVNPRPKDYPCCLPWCGDDYTLLSAQEIYYGESCAALAGSQVCTVCTHEPLQGGCGTIPRKVLNGLSIKTKLPPSTVIQHFCNIITEFNALRDSGNTHGMKQVWLDDVCCDIYKFLEEDCKDFDISGTELCRHPCIWTGVKFVHADAVARNSTYSGPYLFKVPTFLKNKTELLNAIEVKEHFTIEDMQAALKKIKEDYRDTPISKDCIKFIPNLLGDLLEKMAHVEDNSVESAVFLPDTDCIMQRACELAYNDAQWLRPPEDIRFVHDDIPRQFAVQLGVQSVRSRFLESYEDRCEGIEFGQSEELTQRIKNILRDYPLDITILKELLQNADDAKATKMYIILDKRSHGTKKLPSEEWKDLQGPALLVWNNSAFREEDLEGIQRLGFGSKRSEAETIGMYGIGFNVVYHLTDCPSFISTESNGKSTFCVLDPHCRYIPGAKQLKPGRRFNDVDQEFWLQWSDLQTAYLRKRIDLPCQMKYGSLFRFPLRHSKKLVTKSQLVDHDSLSNPVDFLKTISACEMLNKLKTWAPELKQVLLFLNNVTELKMFIISNSSRDKMQLTHWYQAQINEHARETRTQFLGKVQKFGKDALEPFLERYTLTVTEKGIGNEKDKNDEWFIQQGVGDVCKPTQHWEFLPHIQPKHGIAAPICVPSRASEMRLKSRVFCFLPLQMCSNLPVHVNGSFILDSSRRQLWQSNSQNDRTTWNERLIEAISSSYVEFLIHFQDVCIDPEGTERKAALRSRIKQYYNAFPTWLGRNAKFPPPEEECLSLAKMVYTKLLSTNARVLVHIENPTSKKVHQVKFLPLIDEEAPHNQAYFWNEKTKGNEIPQVLRRIGMQLTDAPIRILRHFLDVTETKYLLSNASCIETFYYYSKFNQDLFSIIPQHIEDTCFQSVSAFKMFTEYILTSSHETGDEVGTLVFPKSPQGLPLLLTADCQLRHFNETNEVIRSQFSLVFCQQAGGNFLHPELLDVKYTTRYFLQPSQKNWDKIHAILAAVLPTPLTSVMVRRTTQYKDILLSMWGCLINDEIFYFHLNDIVHIWALIPSSWEQDLSVFSSQSDFLPVMPPKENDEEKRVFKALQNVGMPTANTTLDGYELCRVFCPTVSQPELVLKSLYNFYRKGYMQNLFDRTQSLPSTAETLLTYFSKIHLSQTPESLTQVKSLPLFKNISGDFCPITGDAFIWPRGVCKAGQRVWLQALGMNAVFLQKNGNWKCLGTADVLGISEMTAFGFYNEYIFRVFDQFTEEERFKHLKHIRDQLYADAEHQSKSGDKMVVTKCFINNLKKLPFLLKDDVLQPVSVFYDPWNEIFSEFAEFFIFPPQQMRNDGWLTFLRKIGLCVTVEKEKFKALCKYVESGKCHNKCINASSILVKYLFQEETWYEDEQFLTEVSTIAFLVASDVPRLGWIKDCAPPGNTIQIGKVSVKLTSFSKSAEIRNSPLIWTVKPVVHLSPLSCKVQNRQKVRMELLSHLNIGNITAEEVIQNIINISDTPFSNFENFDKYPQHCKQPKNPSIDPLFEVLLKNFEFLNEKSKNQEHLPLSRLCGFPCIPVNAMGETDQIVCPVLVKPLQVLATPPDELKPFSYFLNPLPQKLYSCLHNVLTPIQVHQSVMLEHVRGALETIHATVYQPLDINTANVVGSLLEKLQELLTRQHNSKDELQIVESLTPLYLPNSKRCLVQTNLLVYEDSTSRHFKNRHINLEEMEYSMFSLFTYDAAYKQLQERKFCQCLPQSVAPKPLSALCNLVMHDNVEDVETSELVEALEKRFCRLILPIAISAVLIKSNTHVKTSDFFKNTRFITVTKIPVEVYLNTGNKKHIGTAEVEFYSKKQNDCYIVYVEADVGFRKQRSFKNLAALVLKTISEMNEYGKNYFQEHEDLVSQLLQADDDEEIVDILMDHGIRLESEELTSIKSFDPNLKPKLGNVIPKSWHHRLEQDIDNLFRPGDWVGYEETENTVVFAQIVYKCDEDEGTNTFDRYRIYAKENDPCGILVSIIFIYKIRRSLEKPTDRSSETSLVLHDRDSNASRQRRQFDTDEVKRAQKHIFAELERIWRLPAELRRRAIRRLYLNWHPDKRDDKALAKEAFQFLQ